MTTTSSGVLLVAGFCIHAGSVGGTMAAFGSEGMRIGAAVPVWARAAYIAAIVGLTRLPWLIRHSRRTLGIVRQNIGFALTVKAIFVVLTLFGHATLWSAIAADMGASLLVIINRLRLLGDMPEARGA